MKKSIIIFCTILTTLSLTAFGYMNSRNTVANQEDCKQADLDLYYHLSNRWSTMMKEDLKKVKSILDIIHDDGTYTREAFKNVTSPARFSNETAIDRPRSGPSFLIRISAI